MLVYLGKTKDILDAEEFAVNNRAAIAARGGHLDVANEVDEDMEIVGGLVRIILADDDGLDVSTLLPSISFDRMRASVNVPVPESGA